MGFENEQMSPGHFPNSSLGRNPIAKSPFKVARKPDIGDKESKSWTLGQVWDTRGRSGPWGCGSLRVNK